MEYLKRGDVLSLLRSSIALAWSDPLLKIATDVAQGVSYLHNCDPPLVHRDLKSSNLLCTRTYSCKVSDFGESKRQLLPGKLFSTIVGTPYWLAPEILREERYDMQVDCYSFGVILVELETRHEPYHDLPKNYTTIDIMMSVSRGALRPTIPVSCSPCRRKLITRCLDNDPRRRPKMTEILYALQHEVRQELLDQNSMDVVSDKRRMVLMQQHQRLNRRGLQNLMHAHDEDAG
uniref:Protein kinase domain-containing protein n=1 Tax=Hyaloperonospora arabidopsidis (strain Emoy2) TaxID=559515 RepID=M4B2U1_HYAAE